MRGQLSFFGAAKRSFPFLFGGIWLVCGIPFLLIGLYTGIDAIRQHERFQHEAAVAEGMVLTKRISRNKNSTTHWVGYRFPAADGTIVRNEVQVSADLWDRLIEREPVRVTYLPGQPRANRIEGAATDWMLPGIFTLFGLFFVPIGGWIFGKGLRGVLRQLRLQTEGTRADATVVDVGPANVRFNGVLQWRIRYQYRDHRGQTHTGESGVMPPEEAQEWTAGDTAVARFDPHAPTKSVWVGRA